MFFRRRLVAVNGVASCLNEPSDIRRFVDDEEVTLRFVHVERRVDPHDGRMYSKRDFVAYYGDTAGGTLWGRAPSIPREQRLKALPPGDDDAFAEGDAAEVRVLPWASLSITFPAHGRR
jgi:hypothetical protein